MKTPILGSTYVARSLSAAANRMVNLFPEIVPEGGTEPAFLNRAPGLRRIGTVGEGPIRGMRVVKGNLYAVSGQELYKVFPDPVVTVTPGSWSETENCGIASVTNITGSGTITFTVTGDYKYQFTTGTETWPATPSPWSEIVAGSPHAFTLATVTFDAEAPVVPPPAAEMNVVYTETEMMVQVSGVDTGNLVSGLPPEGVIVRIYNEFGSYLDYRKVGLLSEFVVVIPYVPGQFRRLTVETYREPWDGIRYGAVQVQIEVTMPMEVTHGDFTQTFVNSLTGSTTVTSYGELLGPLSGTGPVSMADNGTQLFIACDGPSYLYNVETDDFAPITDPDFPGAVTVGYLDGYFVFNEPDSQKLWITGLLNGGVIDPLDFASAEGAPDKVVGLMIDHREVWVFGTETVEVWYNSGAGDFPLQRINGAFNEIGCASAFSVAKLDNGLFWLGDDGVVYRANGYTGNRVSTHAVEWQLQQLGDLSGAVAYTYSQDGHSFYILTVPGADTTWVYDVVTEAWHERAGFENGDFTRHRGNCQAFFNNEPVIGDYENGNLYALDLDTFSDNGATQKWLRSWRALAMGQNNLKRTAHHSLQLDCEAGVGLNLGQGSEPEVMLRWSDDGGFTWSNEHRVKMGGLGQYGKRVIWRRLGMTMKLRDRVYEVSGTDPVKIIIRGAELIASGTNA